MHNYYIENIAVHIPQSVLEMERIFDDMIFDNSMKHQISFINPEIFIQTCKDQTLRDYFQDCDYNFVDGVGLLLAINHSIDEADFQGKDRYPGTDFFSYLPKDKIIRVFLFGAEEANNIEACNRIGRQYPNIEICGRINGYTEMTDEEIVETINDSNADIVIVCLGCPRQELWIKKNAEMISAKIIFGNGGAIDFWSGAVKRAPYFFMKYNMEWFYRLLQDFNWKRIRRQLKLIPFFVKIMTKKIAIREAYL